ncbi:MFS transporter [Staphylococcus saprophyticus]|uniref:MFS transporter n=1 Tax=Staphylococcus saprophyticus TaxID=29385 RepID=UPI00289FA7A3|nr:MFS transporter [Staphylococcus saprophyticus]
MLYGQSLSFLGDYCILPALLVLSTYYDNAWVTSGVVIVRSLPLVIQPFVGGLIDGLDKLKVMIVTDYLRVVVFLSILFIPYGHYPILFLSLLFLAYLSGIFFTPARLATMSVLGEDVKKVNIIFSRYTSFFITLGAVLGVIFILLGNVKYAVVLNSLTYFLSAIYLSKIKNLNYEKVELSSMNIQELTRGFIVIFKNKYLFNAVFTMFTMAILWGIMYSYFPIISNNLNIKDVGNFYLTISIGVGGVIGALVVNKLGFNTKLGSLVFAIVSMSTVVAFIQSSNFIYAFIIACIFFATMEYGEVIAKVNVQENAENAIHGRIFSISEAIIGLSISLGSILMNFTNTFGLSIITVVLILVFFFNTIYTYINKKEHKYESF